MTNLYLPPSLPLLFCLPTLRSLAHALRIKMPANNRMHSSAALRTTDMWSNVIGVYVNIRVHMSKCVKGYVKTGCNTRTQNMYIRIHPRQYLYSYEQVCQGVMKAVAIHTQKYIRTYTHTHTHTYTHTHTQIHAGKFAHTHANTHTHAHKHTLTHT
jgi:hypothetical protein